MKATRKYTHRYIHTSPRKPQLTLSPLTQLPPSPRHGLRPINLSSPITRPHCLSHMGTGPELQHQVPAHRALEMGWRGGYYEG
jgi:hypothetical protein